MRIVHVVVKGRVQGVGYRAWCAREAQARGLRGWVRNRRNGDVEAIFIGPSGHVNEMLDVCRAGPASARVDDVQTRERGEQDFDAALAAGDKASFIVLETA